MSGKIRVRPTPWIWRWWHMGQKIRVVKFRAWKSSRLDVGTVPYFVINFWKYKRKFEPQKSGNVQKGIHIRLNTTYGEWNQNKMIGNSFLQSQWADHKKWVSKETGFAKINSIRMWVCGLKNTTISLPAAIFGNEYQNFYPQAFCHNFKILQLEMQFALTWKCHIYDWQFLSTTFFTN